MGGFIDSAAGPRVFTVAAGASLADAVAAALWRDYGDDPLTLGEVTVLLPTRRACHAMADAFLRQAGGTPILAPRLQPIGDVDVEGGLLEAADLPSVDAVFDLPPAIGPLRRQLLLARLIMARGDLALPPDQAVALAAELARLIDRTQTERLGFDRLADLVPEALAAHWQLTVDFLAIVSDLWPRILADEGAMDPAARRDRLVSALADSWRRRPPPGPVIAAGSTGSIPATADLLSVIAGLDRGVVILPGLDRTMDAESWAAIDETHPQSGLKRLLAHLGVDRDQVADWPVPVGLDGPDRSRLVTEIMRPAATTDAWRATGLTARDLAGLSRIDCATERQEALAIALTMRQALEEEGRTCALITADRSLARRVAAALRHWGVEVDDSAGRPLSQTPAALFLRLIADSAADGVGPVSLLSLLKHPLAAGGLAPAAFRSLARRLETATLRGPRPAPGWAGLSRLLDRDDGDGEGLRAWVTDLGSALQPFLALFDGPGVAPTDLVAAHVAVAEALAATDRDDGAERLWRGDDGERLAAFLAELMEASADLPPMPPARYPAWLEAMMAGQVVRPRFGTHPRLSIWGTLEARLQSADVLVLGGLNEGSWPGDPAVDPWMSRPMRARFGLPAPERRTGLAAHDFAQALAAPTVLMTRAMRVDGAPTVPSRWLLRLEAVLEGAGLRLDAAAPLQDWADTLDAPAAVRPCAPPAPKPPASARPQRLSVTQIGTLMANPYAIYAAGVLRLRPLDPLEASPGAAERGQFIHAALNRFVRERMAPGDPAALQRLLAYGREAFGDALAYPAVAAFWWPRFERIAAWFLERERERTPTTRPLATEVAGEITVPSVPVTLVARADRIDQRDGGDLEIIDYKTGAVPSDPQVEFGFAPQLPLEAAMAAAGAFPGVPPQAVAELAYWKLSGGDPPGTIKRLPADRVGDWIYGAWTGLREVLSRFADPATPYLCRPTPAYIPRFDDYAHLARVQEWSAGGGGDPP